MSRARVLTRLLGMASLLLGTVCGQVVGGAGNEPDPASSGGPGSAPALRLPNTSEPPGVVATRSGTDEPWAVALSAPARPGPDGTLLVDGLLNGGFEALADSTSEPPKYGAYWSGAFSPREGEGRDSIEQGPEAFEGQRWLRLDPAQPRVHQKIVAHPAWTERLVLHLAWRPAAGTSGDGGALRLGLVDGPGREVWLPAPAEQTPGLHGWRQARVDLGAAFTALHGERPVPRLQLVLALPEGGTDAVDLDGLCLEVPMPRITAAELAERIEELARWTFRTWIEPTERGGLGLLDPATGWVVVEQFDVTTGAEPERRAVQTIHSLHTLMVRWLAACEARGDAASRELVLPSLRAFTSTLLDQHLHPQTGLPRLVKPGKGPLDGQPVTVGAFAEFLLEAAQHLDDPALAARARAAVRRMADTLLAAQQAHDLDPETRPNSLSLDKASGVLSGDTSNWFGHIPERLTPLGQIDTPKRFNTAWAIVTGRSFWYHLTRSPAVVVAAHGVEPRPGDLAGVTRALSRYERPWDASRYDLENDTDDHYGYLCEDLLWALGQGVAVPRALELLQGATDHRLDRTARDAGETLWIQGVRLGSACAGDSPRALKGLLDLYELPPEINPVSSGLPLYRQALLELAANDFKGRQLTNSQFTESFFKDWEMVCICYLGTYQGDCRERPLEEWDGDVGDIFGGPPLQGINAQTWAWRVAGEAERPEILARLATLMDVTERDLRAQHGYLFGLDPAIARQYELPPKYTIGLSARTAAGLGYVGAWLELLPHLADGP